MRQSVLPVVPRRQLARIYVFAASKYVNTCELCGVTMVSRPRSRSTWRWRAFRAPARLLHHLKPGVAHEAGVVTCRIVADKRIKVVKPRIAVRPERPYLVHLAHQIAARHAARCAGPSREAQGPRRARGGLRRHVRRPLEDDPGRHHQPLRARALDASEPWY